MRVCVVGSNGVVGRSLVEHFRFLGHEVVESDRNSLISLPEAAADCDVGLWDLSRFVQRERSSMGHQAQGV